MNLTHIERVNQ